MKPPIQIDYEWLASGAIDSAERAGFAAITILINDRPLTELEDMVAKTIRSSARVSAHDLALWFASNWWRLRWEPQQDTISWKMSHQIAAIGGGYAWPDISFCSDGDFVLISGKPSSHWSGAPIRYLHSCEESIGACEFEQGIDLFIEAVLERIAAFDKIQSPLLSLWMEVCDERQNTEMAAWRKLEALLGYDPGEAPPGQVEELLTMAKKVGFGAIEEIASASQSNALDHVRTLMECQGEAITAIVPGRDGLREKIRQIDRARFPWQQAEQAAILTRGAWGLSQGEPIHNKDFCDLLGLPVAFLERGCARQSSLAAGFRDTPVHDGLKVMLTKRPVTSRRFELSRLIGDDLSTQITENLLPATHAKTSRQKFQRAFAQELLCPYKALDSFFGDKVPDDDEMEEAADHFLVSPLLLKTILVNRGRLSRFELA